MPASDQRRPRGSWVDASTAYTRADAAIERASAGIQLSAAGAFALVTVPWVATIPGSLLLLPI